MIRMKSYLWIIVCSLGMAACQPSSSITGPQTSSASPLFKEIGRPEIGEVSAFSTTLRARHVTVDFQALTATATTLTLNLFDDVTVLAVLDRIEQNPSGSFSWVGHLNDITYSEVILVVNDGILMGTIALPPAFYQIRYVRDGVHEIAQINQAAFPPD